MGVLFINLAATLETQESGADTGCQTAGFELLNIFSNLVPFATYLLVQESLVHKI